MIKVAFFQKVWFVFQISKSPKKKYSKTTILNLKFKFPAQNTLLLLAGNLNFKLRIVFWNIFFGDLKNKLHFLKKKTPLKTLKGIWDYHDDVDDRFEPLEPLDSWLWSFVMGVETGFFSVSVTATGVLDQSRLSRHNCCKYNIRKLYLNMLSKETWMTDF